MALSGLLDTGRSIQKIDVEGPFNENIDPAFKRFEIYSTEANCEIKIKAEGIEFESEHIKLNNVTYKYMDIKFNPKNPVIAISLSKDQTVIEEGKFNIQNMTWE